MSCAWSGRACWVGWQGAVREGNGRRCQEMLRGRAFLVARVGVAFCRCKGLCRVALPGVDGSLAGS